MKAENNLSIVMIFPSTLNSKNLSLAGTWKIE